MFVEPGKNGLEALGDSRLYRGVTAHGHIHQVRHLILREEEKERSEHAGVSEREKGD